MTVAYCSHRRVDSPPGPSAWEFLPLPDLLARCDILTIHTPLTSETRRLIGARELAQMRRSAIVINTARGAIIDESALAAAVTNGVIAGAGLDVFEDEPRVDPGLSSLPQVVLLPHLGSATMATRVEMGMTCVNNIEAVLAGRAAPNQVYEP
jgi:glyoxylate reductase